jgi:8-oxo-dGTP pyrophosphatase MutT (NUDIX family)
MGRTILGKDVSGAIVLVYTLDAAGPIFLMGEETEYVTNDKIIRQKYKSPDSENIYTAFEHPGNTGNTVELEAANKKFAKSAKDLESKYPALGHVTYANVKNSSKPGIISAKPRYVPVERRNSFGYTKGSYEPSLDASINDCAVREVWEEIGIHLDITRLNDTDICIYSGPTSKYEIFLYELTSEEAAQITSNSTLVNKMADPENELHNVQFIRVPQKNRKNFFTNLTSRNAFEKTESIIQPGKPKSGGFRGGKSKRSIWGRRRTYRLR